MNKLQVLFFLIVSAVLYSFNSVFFLIFCSIVVLVYINTKTKFLNKILNMIKIGDNFRKSSKEEEKKWSKLVSYKSEIDKMNREL